MATANNPYPVTTRHGRWFIAIGLLTLVVFGLRTISHSDFWMTLACGRWIAAHGVPYTDPFSLTRGPHAPWIDASWLYDLLTYQLWSAGGATLVTVVHMAFVLATFLLLVRVARQFGGPISITFALLVSGWLLAPAFVARARVLTLIFPALFMVVLAGGGRRWWAWLVLLPAQVLWANMFHTFRLGPAICLIVALDQFLHWRRAQRGEVEAGTETDRWLWLHPLLLAAGTLAVTLLTPYGLELHRSVWGIGINATALMISEDISVFGHLFSTTSTTRLIWFAAIINLMGLVAEKQRLPPGITLLALLGTGLAIMVPHYVPLMAVLSFPFFVLSIRAAGCFLWDAFSDILQRQSALVARLVLVGILLIPAFTLARLVSNHYYYVTGSNSAFGFGVNEEAFPVAAAPVLARPAMPAVVINNPLDGGALLWNLPGRPVFADARVGFYGPALMQLVSRGFAGDPQAWQALENRFGPGAVLLNCCHGHSVYGDLRNLALQNLLASGHWSLAYFDGTSALLLRTTPENRVLLQDQQLKLLGMANLEVARRAYERRVAAHWFPTHSPALIGAGSLLITLRQYGEAGKVFELLTRGAPQLASAWLDLGICRWYQGHPAEALPALFRATQGLPRNALAWLWYGKTCQQLNMPQEAKEAFQRAQKLNPVLAASFLEEAQAPLAATLTRPTTR